MTHSGMIQVERSWILNRIIPPIWPNGAMAIMPTKGLYKIYNVPAVN
jgi:hypothetical protein